MTAETTVPVATAMDGRERAMAIVIVNPNPVFDRTITLEELVPGGVMRTLDVEVTAGGKGINVARVLRALGRRSTLLVPVGRDDLARYAALLDAEGAEATLVGIEGPVRTASIYLEQRHARVTVVNDAGHPMSAADWAAVRAGIVDATAPGDLVLSMGSFPPGLDPSSLAELVQVVHDARASILVDANPAWLAASLDARPDIVTPNIDEAEAALGLGTAHVMASDHPDRELVRARAEAAAAELTGRGAACALVTAGSAGVAMARDGRVTWHTAYPVEVVSTVGAGDSFVAGFAAAWADAHGHPDWAAAVDAGIATAAASCEQVRAGGVVPSRVAEIALALAGRVAS